jgi:hypothetical protein
MPYQWFTPPGKDGFADQKQDGCEKKEAPGPLTRLSLPQDSLWIRPFEKVTSLSPGSGAGRDLSLRRSGNRELGRIDPSGIGLLRIDIYGKGPPHGTALVPLPYLIEPRSRQLR